MSKSITYYAFLLSTGYMVGGGTFVLAMGLLRQGEYVFSLIIALCSLINLAIGYMSSTKVIQGAQEQAVLDYRMKEWKNDRL